MSFTNEALSLQSSNFVALPPQQASGAGGGNPILRFPFRAPGKMPSTSGPSKSFSAGRSRGGGSLSPQPRQAVDNQYVTSMGENSFQQRGGFSGGQHFRTGHESGDHLSLSLPHNARHTTLSSPEPLVESVRRSFTPEKSGGKSDLPVTPRS